MTKQKVVVKPARRARGAVLVIDTGSPVVDKLLHLYATQLDSGTPGQSKVCNYQGLQGLASSYHALPPDVQLITRLPSQLRTREQEDALAAFGYKVLMGNV